MLPIEPVKAGLPSVAIQEGAAQEVAYYTPDNNFRERGGYLYNDEGKCIGQTHWKPLGFYYHFMGKMAPRIKHEEEVVVLKRICFPIGSRRS